jgi:hypothetical protein
VLKTKNLVHLYGELLCNYSLVLVLSIDCGFQDAEQNRRGKVLLADSVLLLILAKALQKAEPNAQSWIHVLVAFLRLFVGETLMLEKESQKIDAF